MKLLTTVTIKQILTENSKEELFNRFASKKIQLQKEIDQFHFEMKRLEKTKKYSLSSLQQFFEKEMENRREKIKLLDFQLEQLQLLPLESELTEGEVQGLVDIEVGDNWNDTILGKTIIIREGVVEDIR